MALNFDLRNKTIVLTGSAGRVGSRFSEILSKAGANLVLIDKDIEKNERLFKKIKKLKINITGPLSADTLFLSKNQKKFDVIVGMYHDQVLTPIKTIMGFKAINITLGLPFIRVSPDHGVAADIVGKKVADPSSLIESIKFFNNIQ